MIFYVVELDDIIEIRVTQESIKIVRRDVYFNESIPIWSCTMVLLGTL
jgi:hypothetical protein